MQPYGDQTLLDLARLVCGEIEKLPASMHQSRLIAHASAVAFALQQLQAHGDFFWPRDAASQEVTHVPQ